MEKAELLKLILIGDKCVGKSCLIHKFTDDSFKEDTE